MSMASGSFIQADVLCPFYKYDDGRRRITCEGLADDSSIALIFHHRAVYDNWMADYCCGEYRDCSVCRLLIRKYDDDEEDE